MKEYLLLWSGHMYGMRKARIPAIENPGICGHWRGDKCFVPDRDALRTALPFRYRGMLDRALSFWFDKQRNNAPATIHLCDTRGKYCHTIVLQPLF